MASDSSSCSSSSSSSSSSSDGNSSEDDSGQESLHAHKKRYHFEKFDTTCFGYLKF